MSHTEERYAKAIRTSHMELKETPGDVDTIIAAGMSEALGVELARLRTEWDAVSKRELKNAGNSHTARVLVMMDLRSLQPVKRELYEFALKQAYHKGVRDGADEARGELGALTARLAETMSQEARAELLAAHLLKAREVVDLVAAHRGRMGDLVGRVINNWLDQLCDACDGRGFNGGFGIPKTICCSCGGTKHRRPGRLSDINSEHHFGQWLLVVMETRCSASMRQMQRKQRQSA